MWDADETKHFDQMSAFFEVQERLMEILSTPQERSLPFDYQ